MKKFALLAIFLALPLLSFGQSAKVIALSPADAAQAKSLYAQQADIEKRIADLQASITHKYLLASKEEEGHTNTIGYGTKDFMWVKNGWGTGAFQFSEDFKFIVPSPVSNSIPYTHVCCSSSPFFTVGPATGLTIAN